jgi:DNA helicase-2/ATP-dependent DNA helicase PcrA
MELPPEGVQTVDSSGAGSRAADQWRGGGAAAQAGWADAGVTPMSKDGYAVGMLVKHDQYGTGRVTDLSGFGARRQIKVRFGGHGVKTFIVGMVKLEVVRPQ